jgi:hypothetical protein
MLGAYASFGHLEPSGYKPVTARKLCGSVSVMVPLHGALYMSSHLTLSSEEIHDVMFM